MITFPCLSSNNLSAPAYLSPKSLPTQTPSYIIHVQEHKLPHQYRPFRIPPPKQRTAHDLIAPLLNLGEAIPKGSFLPIHTKKEKRGVVGRWRDSYGRWHGERVDQQVQNIVKTGVLVDVHEEIVEDYVSVVIGVESPLPPPLPPKESQPIKRGNGSAKSIIRRRDTIKAAQAALARGTSCSSTASTVKQSPVVTRPATKPKRQVPAKLQLVNANTKRAGSPMTLSSEDDEAPRTPTGEELLVVPVVQGERAPPTPLNLPPTPLDIPVDWDDLRERWTIGDYYQSSLTHHVEIEEEEEEHGGIEIDERSAVLPLEVASPSPVHAYAGAVLSSSAGVTELNLCSMTSRDLGQYFLDPKHVALDGQATSSLLAPPDWAPLKSRNNIASFNEVGSRKSVIIFNPESLRSTLIIDDFPIPPGSFTPTTTNTKATPIESPIVSTTKRKMNSFVFPPPLPPPTNALPPLPKANQKPPTTSSLKPLVTAGLNGSRPAASAGAQARPGVIKKGGKRHGRLVSLDEAELVMRTVRFSTTLDPQFDYTRFQTADVQGPSVASPVSPQELIAGESFLSVASPLSPMNRRWSQSAF